jgi:hypothetical protein
LAPFCFCAQTQPPAESEVGEMLPRRFEEFNAKVKVLVAPLIVKSAD